MSRLNDEKKAKRKEQDEKEVRSKSQYKERVGKYHKAMHNLKYEKFRAKESVTKITAARKLEMDAVTAREKAKHAEYTSMKAIDEKRRKAASKAVADAINKKREAAKLVKGAFFKKGETQANVLLMQEEKNRKAARRLDEGNELLYKLSE